MRDERKGPDIMKAIIIGTFSFLGSIFLIYLFVQAMNYLADRGKVWLFLLICSSIFGLIMSSYVAWNEKNPGRE